MTKTTRSAVATSPLLQRIQQRHAAEAAAAEADLAALPQDRRVTTPRRGRPATGRKPVISLRVPADLLAWYKEQGPGYQARMIAALEHERQHVG